MKSVLLIGVLFLSACASHRLDYTSPIGTEGNGTNFVKKSFNKVWENLVEGLASQNYVIDSVNKDSGLIVASKKLNPPSSFADCGKWTGHFKNMKVDEKYDFSGADSANYMSKSGDIYWAVSRISTLTSKSNIFVKKVEVNKTSVTVNSQFNLRFDFSSSAYIYDRGQVYDRGQLTMDWTSGETGRFGGSNKTECISNFNLEKSILKMAE